MVRHCRKIVGGACDKMIVTTVARGENTSWKRVARLFTPKNAMPSVRHCRRNVRATQSHEDCVARCPTADISLGPRRKTGGRRRRDKRRAFVTLVFRPNTKLQTAFRAEG